MLRGIFAVRLTFSGGRTSPSRHPYGSDSYTEPRAPGSLGRGLFRENGQAQRRGEVVIGINLFELNKGHGRPPCTGVLEEVIEELELLGGQMVDAFAALHLMAFQIDLDCLQPHNPDVRSDGRSPDYSVDAGSQFLNAERFRDIVVGAAFQGLHLFLLGFPCRHDDDRYFGTFTNQLARLDSPDAGHLQIDQNHVRSRVPQILQRLLAASRVGYLESARDEGYSQSAPRLRLVIDNQDLRSTQFPPPSSGLAIFDSTGSDT